MDAAAHLIIASVPRNERSRWGYAASDAGRDRLKTAVAAWYGASAMSRDAFRTRFLNPYTSDETVDRLRGAARGLIEAQSYDDLVKAGLDLSTTARQIGADRWPQFIGNAARQAEEAVSKGDVPGVIKVDVGTDAFVAIIVMGTLGLAIGSLLNGQTSKLPPATTTAPVLMATPPRDAKDPKGAKAPGKPGLRKDLAIRKVAKVGFQTRMVKAMDGKTHVVMSGFQVGLEGMRTEALTGMQSLLAGNMTISIQVEIKGQADEKCSGHRRRCQLHLPNICFY